jgi:hypothetical protein
MPNRSLFVIRVGMISGILAFALAAWFVRRNGPPDAPPNIETLHTIVLAAAGGAAAALLLLRTRLRGATATARARLTIIAWAIAEFGALAGLAFYLVTGLERGAAPGLIAFALGMVLFPVLRD